ncbi:myosin-10-like [Pistacia vera]|uniref:myosin-10-like n=1 Tax=Pistacia vera TaxID=55513 RepID=UPI001262EE8E|nr:myosin-10-like [Pistacia vera]
MFKSARWRSDKTRSSYLQVAVSCNSVAIQWSVNEEWERKKEILIDVARWGKCIDDLCGSWDVGKPTVRSEKAIIENGCCDGEIRSMRLIHGQKAVLHVSIQRVQDNVDQRETEENEDASIKYQSRSLRTQLSNSEAEESNNSNSTEDKSPSKTVPNAELNGNFGASSGSDITLSSSESDSGLNTPRDQVPNSFLSSLSHTTVPNKLTENTQVTIYEEHQRSQWEWSVISDHGISTDDSTNGFQYTFLRERSEQASDNEIEKLKSELVALTRQADLSELELQTLRKQIVKESKRGQDLSREVVSLKEERDLLMVECERLKTFQKRMGEAKVKNRLQFEGRDPWVLIEEIRQELQYEKDLNANLRIQLQKTQESNSELMLAVQDLDEMLEQKNTDISNLSEKSRYRQNAEELRGNIFRSETDDDEEQKALEELVKEHRDAKETYKLEQRVMDLYSEIEIYRRDKDELEMQMEQLALDYEILKQQNHDISYKLEQSQLQEQLKMQYECSSSFANTGELETQIENLESELKKQSKEFSDSLATIKELEAHIKDLEEDLEKQGLVYEADLAAVTRAKIEQEQRAIQAEEALRKTRLKNANTAERLQEEFRRLSAQMASTFDANEKVAMKAFAEASELRTQKSQLEEMLRKAREELLSVRDDYETKLRELSDQLNKKTEQIEQLLDDIDHISKKLEQQQKHEEEVCGALSMEILQLKSEIEKLRTSNDLLSEKAEQKESLRVELEEMKTSVKESELLLQKGNMERHELASQVALLKKEAEKSQEELLRIRHLKDEKEAAFELLKSELEVHKAQCSDLKHSLFEDELEKEKLRKQIFQLKGDLKKKEDAYTILEKKMKDGNRRGSISDGTRTSLRNNKPAPVAQGSKEVASLREKIKMLEGQIKSRETALETSTNSFLEKEKDLRTKIEELECRVEEFNQNSSLCKLSFEKVAEEIKSQSSSSCQFKENGNIMPPVNSNDDNLSEKELKPSTIENKNGNLDDMLTELASLKEKNKSMESELKDMQERYSEISLKFAEVEGERQQLVMTVRNLKNAKKS